MGAAVSKFLTVEEFKVTIGMDELAQIAASGSFNRPEGRVIDIPKIEEAIAFAEQLLISHCRTRYTIIETLTPEAMPNLVKGYISDIARYRLRSRSGGQGQVSEEVRQRYEDALAFLKLVATGKAELPIAGESINGEVGGMKVDAIIPQSPVPAMLHGWRT